MIGFMMFCLNIVLIPALVLFLGVTLVSLFKGRIDVLIFSLIVSIVIFSVLYFANKRYYRYEPEISEEKDDFKNTSWIHISPYEGCRYRALLNDNVLRAIQLYIETRSADWVFFDSAHGEDQTQLQFIEIDSQVKKNGSGNNTSITTHEVFGLIIPFEYLEKMSTKDWKIKAYGKRGDKIFTIPQKMTQPFFEYIKPYIIKNG